MPAKLPDSVWEERKIELLNYLRHNPTAREKDVKAYQSTVDRFFRYSFNEAKLAAGVPRSKVEGYMKRRSESSWRRRKTRLLSYVRDYPHVTYYDISIDPLLFSAYVKFYRGDGGMHQLRSDAGIAIADMSSRRDE